MTLFSATALKPKLSSPTPDERPRARIPTGTPRLMESSSDRAARATIEPWAALLDAVRRSSTARLVLFEGRPGRDRITCPWQRITGCDVTCRCRGAKTVTVEFLRDHYKKLPMAIAMIAMPTSAKRSP